MEWLRAMINAKQGIKKAFIIAEALDEVEAEEDEVEEKRIELVIQKTAAEDAPETPQTKQKVRQLLPEIGKIDKKLTKIATRQLDLRSQVIKQNAKNAMYSKRNLALKQANCNISAIDFS